MKEKLFSIKSSDLVFQTFRSGGKGGQHQNTTDSGVRFIHPPSGAVGESRTEKSQHQNKKLALKRLVGSPKFKLWINKMIMEITTGKTIEQRVEEQMEDKNLKIEYKDENGRWCIEK
jgi:protein subunit release factor B